MHRAIFVVYTLFQATGVAPGPINKALQKIAQAKHFVILNALLHLVQPEISLPLTSPHHDVLKQH